MNKLLKLLPAFALVLAASFAFGFSSPTNGPEYGLDGSQWKEVTGLIPGPDTYECNLSSQVCTRSAPNSTAPMVKQGVFIFNGD
jgi:hypothetical protein